MSENTQPQGKGMAIGGFVLALVGLLLAGLVMGGTYVAMGTKVVAYIWVVLCILSVVLSAMAMSKLGKTGGKKGLAIAGLIIGIVAVVYSVIVLIGLSALDAGIQQLNDLSNSTDWSELNDALNELEDMQ
ncbi:MAG: hypothetical protein EP333_00060 [Bacteroidetes bacterium]|nr:MAG: hypothetical protein EP333_00060 [Bacteroidota bacterium]